MTDRNLFLLAVVCYGAASTYSIFVFRRGFRRDTWINYALLAVGFAFHMGAMSLRGFSMHRCPINNLFEATLFIGWTIVGAYLVLGLWPRLRFLGAFVSPVVFALGVFALMPSLDTPHPAGPNFSGGLSSLHKALILLAYGAFGLSSMAGLMYLMQERDLKFHKARALFSKLPPIQRLELVMSRLLVTGWVLLSVGLIASVLYLRRTLRVYFTGDALAVYSVIVWLLYLGLVVARWRFAQRGRRIAFGSIGGFAFVILTFWGIYLLSGIHNP